MRTLGIAAGALALALPAVGGSALAASRVAVLPGDDGDKILSILEDGSGVKADLVLICSSRTAEFGIVLMVVQPGFPPESADLTFQADGVAVGPLRLSRQAKGLVLAGDGEGREVIGKLTRAGLIEVDIGGLRLGFTLGGAAAEVAGYREYCRL